MMIEDRYGQILKGKKYLDRINKVYVENRFWLKSAYTKFQFF